MMATWRMKTWTKITVLTISTEKSITKLGLGTANHSYKETNTKN
jgi:hypothetical protein